MMLRFASCLLVLPLAMASVPVMAEAPATPAMSFVSIEVADMARAKSFYVDTLGMKPIMTISKPGDSFQKIAYNFSGNPRANETLLILIHHDHPRADQNKSSGAKIGFSVADTRAMAAKVRSAGFEVVGVPAADAKGPVLNSVVRDPDGVIVELVELHVP
jgi:catechol 2,3-dioxygenase-like lactoylglutathione lyase family enzyme